jgi:hypothetical protein
VTTQIYLHVMQKPGLGVKSPLVGEAEVSDQRSGGSGQREKVGGIERRTSNFQLSTFNFQLSTLKGSGVQDYLEPQAEG